MRKKILITGSNGLLGQKLAQLLVHNAEIDLIATSRGHNKLSELLPELHFISLDVTDAQQVEKVIAVERPTHIIHTAAMTNVDGCELNQEACWQLNVAAVQYLVNACEKYKVHLIHLSTDFVFDGEAGPYNEEAQPNPISYYGQSKLAAEKIVQASTVKWAIIRTVLVYGVVHDYGRTNIVLWVKNSLEAQKNIQVVNDQFRTPTLAEDLAMGCWLAVQHDAEGIFHISSKETLTPYEMALQVAEYFNLDKAYIKKADASNFSQPAKRPPRTGFNITKAEKILGFKPHNFSEGIAVVASQI
ncbi:dTDP-4-dehydrorhamnose reductase [Adhaeribacter rhizoryzae]|uniref:dTDP-4-dehydrorhamnose reductase n=1 Tax=Adhaeribacter rhizoryzae TaxID=2607907 RepID=A0A5M6DT64_9BACT|nr:dTDP-4-dehydrorhamnose reductase [Adhaeribacter rhizoryzae]KAA5549496.1 dTDP-4-dehydrorhamnose reductase [Adhaeribacter rhizoryzae]